MAISSVSADLRWKFCPVRRSTITLPPSIYFLRSNFIPKFTSILSNSTTPFLDYKSISNSRLTTSSSPNTISSICNLFNYDDHQTYYCYYFRRMLASSLVLLAAMFMSLFFTQHPALAVSYGRMGSSSRSSSRSSSSSSSSRPFRTSSSSFASCRRRRRRNYYQENSITCTNCSCFKEKKSELDSSSSDVNNGTNLLTSNSNRKGHSPCKCTCHSATIPKPVWVIICIVFILFVIKEGKHQNSDCKTEVADIRMGSVLMVQVGILDKKRELQRKLNRIAGTADTYTIKGLNNLKKEVVKALLEHHDSCHFAYLFAKYDDMEKYSRPCFRGFLETEVAKFDKEDETFVNVDGVICKKDFGGNVISIDNEYSVVTLLVLADGEHWIPSVKWHTPVVDKLDVKIALQMIRLIRMSNLEALEVLWTPQTENDSISEQELRRDFGLLMRPVKLIKKSLLSWF